MDRTQWTTLTASPVQCTGVPRSQGSASSEDPTVGLTLGPFGGAGRGALSYERGAHAPLWNFNIHDANRKKLSGGCAELIIPEVFKVVILPNMPHGRLGGFRFLKHLRFT